jgi:DNA-binding LacI/PurR family transcriptional regulator
MGEEQRRRATLRDVARAAGVSHTTVSNAFSRPDQLSADLRERVLETAQRLAYAGPDPSARSLRRGSHGALGLVLNEDLPYAFADPTAVLLLQGVAQACQERRANLMLIATRAEGESADPAFGASPLAVRDAAVDGFILCSLARDSAVVAPVRGRGLPLVVVDQPRLGGVPYIGVDDLGGARKAAEHLLALGHRRFLILSLNLKADGRSGIASERRIASATYEVSMARLRGYRLAFAAAGLNPTAAPVVECAASDERRARDLTAPLLAGDPATRPTAILAMSDRLALGAIAAARGAGLAVPEHVSVAGFDDVAGDALAGLALTTVRQPHFEKGRAAVEMLMTPGALSERRLTTELIVRASTAPVGRA